MRKFYLLLHRKAVTASLFTALFSFSLTTSFSQGPGTALQYTGTGMNGNGFPNQQYLQFPNGIVQGLSGEFTIEAWVYWPSTTVSAWQRIFDFGTGTSDFMFLTPSTNTNVARFGIVSGGTTEIMDASIAIPTDKWTHVAVTVDNTGTGLFFIDGALVGTAPFTLRPDALGNTTNNYLGRSQFLPDPYFTGVIDEFRISNTARYTAAFTPQQTEFANDVSTVALFHFNEGSGQETWDVTNSMAAVLGFSTAVEPDLDPTWYANSILPVRLQNFAAYKNGRVVELKWTATATGEGGFFIVERSNDGKTFERLASVAISVQPGSVNYNFKDANPRSGKNFYRIRINEINGTPKFSSILWVDLENGDYSLAPTITRNEIFVSVPSATKLSIYDISGVLVKTVQVPASQYLSLSELSAGVYFARFHASGETLRFIKQ